MKNLLIKCKKQGCETTMGIKSPDYCPDHNQLNSEIAPIKRWYNKLIESHKFFVKESNSFIGVFRLKHYLYYPVAYCKFMYYEFKNF